MNSNYAVEDFKRDLLRIKSLTLTEAIDYHNPVKLAEFKILRWLAERELKRIEGGQ